MSPLTRVLLAASTFVLLLGAAWVTVLVVIESHRPREDA